MEFPSLRSDEASRIRVTTREWARVHPAPDVPVLVMADGSAMTPRHIADALDSPDTPAGRTLFRMFAVTLRGDEMKTPPLNDFPTFRSMKFSRTSRQIFHYGTGTLVADLLFILPADDQAAQLSSLIGGRILRWVQYQAHNSPQRTTKDLVGSANATRGNVDNELRNGHSHLFYFGHGMPMALTANGSALVDNTNITSLQTSAIVVAVACYSRSGLGVTSTAQGTITAYLGWEDALPIPNLLPGPMIDALSYGLLPLMQGSDLKATVNERRARFSQALRDYQAWHPPATAGSGAALYAKMAAPFASACLAVEGTSSATL